MNSFIGNFKLHMIFFFIKLHHGCLALGIMKKICQVTICRYTNEENMLSKNMQYMLNGTILKDKYGSSLLKWKSNARFGYSTLNFKLKLFSI